MTFVLPSSQAFLTSLVSLSPERARQISGETVVQRLNYQTGRTLTESAMEREQLWIEQRMGIAGRCLSPGIVEGLQIALADQDATPGTFEIGRGRGITVAGQDVTVLKSARIDVNGVRELGVTGASEAPPRGLVALLLEPASIEVERLPDSGALRMHAFEDPCPPDRDALPYLDYVHQDAARFVFVDLDNTLVGDTPERAANLVAYELRRIEVETPAAASWTRSAVPLAVMFVRDDGRIAWAHRAGVARSGGLLPHARRRPADLLRQSMLEGLVEETALASADGWDGTDIAGFIRFMPPAGVLPRKCWANPGCFPAGWAIAHAPIPLSQLDAALEASGRLDPFDLDATREQLKILVPIPDELYAADLLEPLALPDFDAVLSELRRGVGTRLALRDAYRTQAQSVQGALALAFVTDFNEVDDSPIPGEAVFEADAVTAIPHDTEAERILTGIQSGLSTVLFTEDQRNLVDPARLSGTLVPGTDEFGATSFVEAMRAAIDIANDIVDLSFNRVQAEIYRLRQIMLDNEEATKLATFPALAGLAKGSNSFALSEGLKRHFLAQKEEQPAAPAAPSDNPDGGGGLVLHGFVLDVADATVFEGLATLESGPSTVGLLGDFGSTDRRITDGIAFDTGITGGLQNSTFLTNYASNTSSLLFGANFGKVASVSDKNTNLVKDLVDNTRAELVDDAILSDSVAKRTGILQAPPLPGDIRDIRNATVADRLKTPASVDAKASAVKIKADVIRAMHALDISLEGLRAPLTSSRDRVLLPKDDIDAVIASTLTSDEVNDLGSEINELRRTVAGVSGEWEMMTLQPAEATTGTTAGVTPMTRLSTALLSRKAPITMELLPALALAKELDPDPGKGSDSSDDESAFLNSAIATLEGAIAFLRLVEARILAISKAVDVVASKTKLLNANQKAWNTSLTQADQDLDEARHDLRVAQSLIDEERKRLEARQEEKQRILDTAVKFVAYQRPGVLAPHRDGTRLGLVLPGQMADPLPVALARDLPLADELEDMVETLREMPLGWFTANPELAKEFKKPWYLDHVLNGMQYRAIAQAAKTPASKSKPSKGQSAAQLQIAKIATAYSAMSFSLIQKRKTFDPKILLPLPWKEKKEVALTILSLNDLIAAGREPKVAKKANEEIEKIERVLTALWQTAREIPAPIRLLWATHLSEFDTVKSLQNLAGLPGWSSIDFLLRTRLDRLNTWLFSRMEKSPKEARALMTDIVRVALLLSAHAPVADIIAAALEEEKTVSPGGLIDIRVKRGRPQIGAKVSFLDGNLVQAHGWIKDLSGSKARVEIASTSQSLVHLTERQTVTVYNAQAIGLRAL